VAAGAGRLRPLVRVPLVGALVVTMAAAAGCSGGSDDDSEPASVALGTSCAKIACAGELNGARYRVELPRTWNGTLLIFSHGYRQAHDVPAPVNATVDLSAQDAPTEEVAKALLAKGYALAGSGFRSEGWATSEGVTAAEDLHRWFADKVAQPRRVYVWGESLGGLITEMIAEKHPDWVSGAAPMCGVLAGTNPNLDGALDVAYMLRQIVVPHLKLTGFQSFDEAFGQFERVADKLSKAGDDPTLPPKIVFITSMIQAPLQTGTYDGQDATSFVSGQVEVILRALAYATFDRWELEQRVGGNPSTNADTDYAAMLTGQVERTVGTFGGDARAYLRALERGPRVQADPAARAKAAALGAPTGTLGAPTLTLHTANDPLVEVSNESYFRDTVARAGRLSELAQLYTNIRPKPDGTDRYGPGQPRERAPYGAGHCNFTTTEQVGVIDLLDGWVRHGTYPTPAVAKAAIGKPNGLDPSFAPGPWPTRRRGG
jgi:pimeloyl-ACP methyl ester carboxylesterase